MLRDASLVDGILSWTDPIPSRDQQQWNHDSGWRMTLHSTHGWIGLCI